MGFNGEQPLLDDFRKHFPVSERLIYLNHASVAPLSRPAATAMRRLADDACDFGSLHYAEWMAAYDGLRAAAARLVGAAPTEIAIVKNTSEGVATVALGLDWRSGDKVVVFDEEFPANLYPWQRLAAKGVRVETLSIGDPLGKIDEACQGARLLAISFVQYLGGFRADLNALGEICQRRGCFFFVDAIQGLGAFPIDVESAHIDAFAADGHKWLCGPEGCGVLYVRQSRQDQIEPVEFGWTNVASYADYNSRDTALRIDAGRYECGTLNTIGCFGLRAAIDLTLEIGVDRIAPQVQALADRLAAGVVAKGYQILTPRTPVTGAGIVAFRKASVDSRELVRQWDKHGISAAARRGWVRASPHFYIRDAEIDRAVDTLP